MKDKLIQLLRKLISAPPIILVFLIPISVLLLVLAFTVLGEASPISIIGYVISAYTLTLLCLRIPDIINLIKGIGNSKYVLFFIKNEKARTMLSQGVSLLMNVAYGVFQLVLGIYHGTLWYTSFAIYYFILAFIRYYLADHVYRFYNKNELKREVGKYITTGLLLLVLNLALSVIVVFMVVEGRTFVHHFITTIAMAAFTFTSLTLAIINIVRSRRSPSPVNRALRSVGLTTAIVSILTLTTTMLTSFGEGDTHLDTLILSMTGIGVILVVLTMAISMLVIGISRLKELNKTERILKERTNG